MQRCDVTVRLSGDLNNTVRKPNVTPAEIVILRAIHGGFDSVVDIQPTIMDKTPHANERARLAYAYGNKVVDACFPGQFAVLPVSLKEIAPPEEMPDEENETGQDTMQEFAPPHEEPLDADDMAIIEATHAAKTRAQLHALAKEHEVDLSEVPDKMDDMKKAIITGLFPQYKM